MVNRSSVIFAWISLMALTFAQGCVTVDSPSNAIEEYRIGPTDLVEIQVYGLENLKRDARVNSRGVISLPLLGAVVIGGLTAKEAEVLISEKYEKGFLRNPRVSVFVKEWTGQRITIEGAVNKPGRYPIKGQITLVQAIAIAGGVTTQSDMTAVMLFRTEKGSRTALKFDVLKIRDGEAVDPILQNDDLVVVNRFSPRRIERFASVGVR